MNKSLNIFTLRGAIILDVAFSFAKYKSLLLKQEQNFETNKTWFTLTELDVKTDSLFLTSWKVKNDFESKCSTEIFQYVFFTPDGGANVNADYNLDNVQIASFLTDLLNIYERSEVDFSASNIYKAFNDLLRNEQEDDWVTLRFKPYINFFKIVKIEKSEILQLRDFYLGILKDEKVNFKLVGKPLDPFTGELLKTTLNLIDEACFIIESIDAMMYRYNSFFKAEGKKLLQTSNEQIFNEVRQLIDLRNFIILNRFSPSDFSINSLENSEKTLNQFKNWNLSVI